MKNRLFSSWNYLTPKHLEFVPFIFDRLSTFKASQAKARDLWDAPEDVLDRSLFCGNDGNDIKMTWEGTTIYP